MSTEFLPPLSEVASVEVWKEVASVEVWKSVSDYPDYEISDMGRIRCIKDRKGHKAPFYPSNSLRSLRPVITIRRADMKQDVRRVDELVLATFNGPRPAPHWGAVPLNGDRMDVRADNLAWVEGEGNAPKTLGKKKIRTKKPVAKKPAISKEIRHGHWLGIGNVVVSIQPNGVVELEVSGATNHHAIPATDLDDAIRVLQAAKTIIEG